MLCGCAETHQKKNAITGFDPVTSGLWAQHASSAPNRDTSKIEFYYILNSYFILILTQTIRVVLHPECESRHPLLEMRNLSIALATAVGLLCTGQSAAFHGLTRSNTRYLKMSAVESTEDMGVASLSSLLKRDRYIASNRFRVRKGKEAKFEQRWATRKR